MAQATTDPFAAYAVQEDDPFSAFAADAPDPTQAPPAQGDLSALDHVLGFLKESTASVNPARINQAVQSAFWDTKNTAKNMLAGRQALSEKALSAFREGDYVTGAAKGLEWLIPFLGERMSESGDLLQQGEYGRGLGAAVDVGAQVTAPALARGATSKVKGAMQNRATTLRASSTQDITEALNPTRHRTKVKTERITPGIQQRGLTGDLSDLRTLAKGKLDEVGPQIDAVLKANKGKRVNLKATRAALAREKAKTFNEVPAKKNGKPVIDNTTGKPVTEQAVHNTRKYQQIQAVDDLLAKYGDNMSVEEAVAVRKAWDDVVKQAGGFDEKAGRGAFGVGLSDVSEAAVKSKAVTALRNEIVNKAVPSVKALNREYGFWADLHDVTSASKFRKVGQHKTGFLGKTVENTGRVLGGGIGYATGGLWGAGTGTLAGGAVAKRLTNLFSSPRWKLTASAQKVRLANALATGNPTRIGDAIAAIERAGPVGQAAVRETAGTLPKAAEREPAR